MDRSTTPAATCCLRPATRTIKNSVRFELNDRQELDALKERIPLVLGLLQHATEERQETQALD